MFSLNAPWKKTAFFCHGAFCLFALILCPGCIKSKPKNINQDDNEQSKIADDFNILASEHLRRIAANCRGQHQSDIPVLIAHFLDESENKEVCFSDIASNIPGTLSCAPGPFSLEHQIAVDVNEKQWQLETMPNYFVWHLGKRKGGPSFGDEHFYITNSHGLPIKSHVVKLQNNQDSALVLFPKKPIPSGTKFFIYLTLTQGLVEKTWIQPIEAISAKPKQDRNQEM